MDKKYLYIGIPIVIVALIFLFTGSKASPTELVDEFRETVENRDAKGLVKLVEVGDNVQWDVDDAQSIIEYLQEDDDDFSEQIALLYAQASYYDTDGQVHNRYTELFPGESITHVGPFYLTKVKKFIGEKYELRARGYTLTVQADKDAKVTLKDEEIKFKDEAEKEIGQFGPGVYTIKAEKKYEYTTVENETTVTLFEPEDFERTATLDLTGETVTVTSNMPNTALLVNGKKVDVTIEGSAEFGPVVDGLELEGEAELPWGTVKSPKVTIGDESENANHGTLNITPNPASDKKVQDVLVKTINDFYKSTINAKVKQDEKLLKNMSDNLKKDYVTTIDRYKNDSYNRHFKGEALGTRIDFSRVDYEYGSGGNHLIKVPVELHEKTEEVVFSEKGVENKYFERMIVLQYVEKDKNWIVNEVGGDHSRNVNDYMTSDAVVKTTFKE